VDTYFIRQQTARKKKTGLERWRGGMGSQGIEEVGSRTGAKGLERRRVERVGGMGVTTRSGKYCTIT
jgi:hypothetical protein